jgi:AMMECR1 domain-containing protein
MSWKVEKFFLNFGIKLKNMHPLVSLAKSAVENYILEKKIISPPEDLPKEFLEKRAGTFVTIEKNGELRGCIGTYLPTERKHCNRSDLQCHRRRY